MSKLTLPELIERAKDVFSHPANKAVSEFHATEDGCFFTDKNYLRNHIATFKRHGEELAHHTITRAEALGEAVAKEVEEIVAEAKEEVKEEISPNVEMTKEAKTEVKETETQAKKGK